NLDRPVDREQPCCNNVCIIDVGKGPHAGRRTLLRRLRPLPRLAQQIYCRMDRRRRDALRCAQHANRRAHSPTHTKRRGTSSTSTTASNDTTTRPTMTIEKNLHALPPVEQRPSNGPPTEDEAMSIAKPSAFSLDKFKSKHAAALANVETLLTALPH